MNLSDIRKAKIPRKYKFPVGRGHSSGVGKTCGRGRKGQYARTGTSFRAYFEGGQMPNIRRLPKRGFNNKVFKVDWEVVNVGQLERIFAAGETVDAASLRAKGLVRRDADGIKLLSGGELKKKLIVKVDAATAAAEQKVVKAGGSLERLAKAEAPGKPQKKAKAGPPEAAKKGGAEPPKK